MAVNNKSAARRRSTGSRAGAGVQKTTALRDGAEQPLMKALRAEHRHMATVMQLFEEQLCAIEAGELVDTHVVYEIMDYMVCWPDRFHHPREDMIYARLAERHAGARDDVDTLQRDHDESARRGRKLLTDIKRWRAGGLDGKAIVKSGRDYVEHCYGHMNLEEKLVFPQIETGLTLRDWRELAADDQLEAVSSPVFGPRVTREFRNLARKLKRGVRRSVERGTMVEWIGIEAFMESLDVLAIAYESALDTTGEHLREALHDSGDLLLEAPLRAPWRIAANNTRVSFRLLGDVLKISRNTLDDLGQVNRDRLDRVRLLDRNEQRR